MKRLDFGEKYRDMESRRLEKLSRQTSASPLFTPGAGRVGSECPPSGM